MDHYNLDENNNIVLCSITEWALLYDTPEGQKKRRVGLDTVHGYEISTVFLGLDHGYDYKNPMLFETMIFDNKGNDIYMTRCTTWKQAEKMHQNAIEWVNNEYKEIGSFNELPEDFERIKNDKMD